uniref:SH2_2 domain-containing protein n=1 Tax=Soboliphyme baturini TaxID=241478 RepID=A0A183IH13_9BILA
LILVFRPGKDYYYDFKAEEEDRREDEAVKAAKEQYYVKRVVAHPCFRNCTFKETQALLTNMEQGDVIVRPSSKGSNRLTVTWKVTDNICQHIDVREEGKETAFSLGRLLYIGEEVLSEPRKLT